MPGLFSEITRIKPSLSRDPREESLTETFAAVLRRSPSAAQAVARICGLSELAGDETVVVQTQQRSAGLERVDIELSFRRPDRPERLLWLELKWDDPPTLGQIDGYALELATRDADGRVVLIAPWWSIAAHDELVVAHTRWTSWTDVALALDRQRRAIGCDVERYLVDEFIDYLRENALSADQGLDLQHLAVLEQANAATERLRALVDALDRAVAQEPGWHPTTWRWRSKAHEDSQLHHYRAHAAVISTGEEITDAYVEYHLQPMPAGLDEHEPLALGAGVKITSVSEPSDLVTRAATNGVDQLRCTRSGPRADWFVMRYLPLTDLLGCATVDTQAQRLADFAHATWRAVEAMPQPS